MSGLYPSAPQMTQVRINLFADGFHFWMYKDFPLFVNLLCDIKPPGVYGEIRLFLRSGNFVYKKRTEEYDENSNKVHRNADKCVATEECAGEERNYRELCAAGHKGSKEGGGAALALVLDGSASHNAGDSTSRANYEGNDRFAGKSYLFKDGIEHDGRSCHISAILKESDEEVHHHNEGKEADNGNKSADYTVNEN